MVVALDIELDFLFFRISIHLKNEIQYSQDRTLWMRIPCRKNKNENVALVFVLFASFTSASAHHRETSPSPDSLAKLVFCFFFVHWLNDDHLKSNAKMLVECVCLLCVCVQNIESARQSNRVDNRLWSSMNTGDSFIQRHKGSSTKKIV